MFDFDFFLSQSGWNIYLFLFISLLAGAFGLPIPEDIPLVAGGVLLHEHHAKAFPLFLICYIGILVGDFIIYSAGRLFGPSLCKTKWFQRKLKKIKLRKVRQNLERKSLLTIFIARHLFWIRTATFIICGIVRIRPIKFIVADAIAASISIPIMISLGYFFFGRLEEIFGHIKKVEGTLFVVLLALVLGFIAYKACLYFYKKNREKNDSVNQM